MGKLVNLIKSGHIFTQLGCCCIFTQLLTQHPNHVFINTCNKQGSMSPYTTTTTTTTYPAESHRSGFGKCKMYAVLIERLFPRDSRLKKGISPYRLIHEPKRYTIHEISSTFNMVNLLRCMDGPMNYDTRKSFSQQ